MMRVLLTYSRLLILCSSMLLSWKPVVSQCTFDIGSTIPDTQSITVEIEVEGLTNGDLGGSQALCAVNIAFRHTYLGDLTITLISPSGQSVELVGPVTDQISPTNLTSWSISFIQCGFPAAPDAGFTATWSNDQAWQILSTYTGSYYPFQGCLEDLDTGSANGTWRLVISDNDALQTGELLSVELVFCDNSGLDCSLCESDAGRFQDTYEVVCQGETLDAAFFEPQFLADTPDVITYDYMYLLSGDGTGFVMLNQVNSGNLPIGAYTVCGLSFDRAETSGLTQHLDSLTLSEVQTAFAQNEIPYCADLTESCVTLEILDLPDTSFLNPVICEGESFTVGGQTFSTPGIYTVDIPVAASCDSVVILDLEVQVITPVVAQQDTVSCDNEVTQLDASGSLTGPGSQFTWTTSTGTILNGSDQQVVTIQGPGTITLTIASGGCSDVLQWEVLTDNSFPFVAVDDGLIDCNDTTFQFEPVTFPEQVTYQWSGPNGFTSTDQSPVVSVSGSYLLNVTDISGCSSTTSVTVEADTVPANMTFLEIKDCDAQNVLLCILPPAGVNDYLWSGPGGFSSTSRTIFVSMPGTYAGTITLPNGCSSYDSIQIDADFAIPEVTINASDDTLNCTEQVILNAETNLAGVDYTWFGPGGFSSPDSVIDVSVPGTYIIETTGQNDCVDRDTIAIVPGDDLFEVIVFHDTINCLRDSAFIGVLPNAVVASYQWSGNGIQDSVAFIQVDQPGVYQVEIIDTAQCVVNALVEVFNDNVPVEFTAVHGLVSCNNPVDTLSFVPKGPVASIEWLHPDQSITTDSMLITSTPGAYRLTLRGPNGCPRTRTVNMLADTSAPVLFADAGSIGCAGSTNLISLVTDTSVTYDWSGPLGFSASTAGVSVSDTGVYSITVTALNGCTSQRDVLVIEDVSPPEIEIDSVAVDCSLPSVYISVAVNDPTVAVAWYIDSTFVDSATVITPGNAGTYVVEATGTNGCITRDTVDFPGFDQPEILTTSDTLTCAVDSVLLTARTVEPNVTFEWLFGNTVLSVDDSVLVGAPGAYSVRAIVDNGCNGIATVEVPIDTVAPVAVIDAGAAVICGPGQAVTLDGSGSVGSQLLYMWSASDGTVLSGANAAQASVTGLGAYALTVEDDVNGCVSMDSIRLLPVSALARITLALTPECSGNGMGSIRVTGVQGATSELVYLLDGEMESMDGTFAGLTAGNYLVGVRDSFGCTVDTLITLDETIGESLVDLGPDQEVIIGDIVTLRAILDADAGSIASIQWEPPLPCDSCLENTIIPGETMVFGIAVVDTFGCLATDEVTVFVSERAKAYVPNVFSPNGDGQNDILEIALHPGIAHILAFRVFDRWGNQVFGANDLLPGDPALAWDGTHNGERVNPGVFTYLMEVELITGRRQLLTGDITLLY